jgi:hypothetical protein
MSAGQEHPGQRERIEDPIVSQFYGKVGPDHCGLPVTPRSSAAHHLAFARSKTNGPFADVKELVDLVVQHYEPHFPQFTNVISRQESGRFP